ncbi:beta-glucosidase 15-like isoform X2 [Euphorbia lathyris]|uniref:beta-glucosidase 15-like isoform X2 n=1 Tax=Euphorbia lathyris TaxID=212925 RepID=UPI0033131994
MRINIFYYLLVLLPVYAEDFIESCTTSSDDLVSRSSFPDGFIFGTASSAYQYEGAANEDGRGPNKIKDHTNGNVADDSYHRYKEDVAIMKSLGFDAYRFSISWSRLLPNGSIRGGINQRGIDYYNNLINELLRNGMKAMITLFHWDLPQGLEDEYGGFLSSKIVNDFSDYAELCFRNYGDRVKEWITLNEPYTYAAEGYGNGEKAPGRCSSLNCSGGDSSTEPYLVTHHQLLAHAAAVRLYKLKFQASQKGVIGITLNSNWILPLSNSTTDLLAASRALAFQYDWFMEPLNSGVYPLEMLNYVGKRMPMFSKQQSLMVKGSFDFIGLNYYTSKYGIDVPCKTKDFGFFTDSCVLLATNNKDGIPIGPQTGSDWLYVYPKGIEQLLLYTKSKFNNPTIYITENGVSDLDSNSVSAVLNDNLRVRYFNDHLLFVQKAIAKGVNVKGYFAWSLLDNFEWNDGYSVRFGMVFVDYQNGLKRHLKDSAIWFNQFLLSHSGNALWIGN